MKEIKKIKVLGIGNKDNYNYLIVRKDKYFFNWLGKIMHNSFKGIPDVDIEEFVDKDDKFISKKKNIKKYKDKHESFGSEEIRVDIFYGDKKIFISFITSLKNRERLMENLEKYSAFVEYKGKWRPKTSK